MVSLDDEARDAAAAAAVAHECLSGQRLALGSGRAVLAVLRNLATRAEQATDLSVVVASRATAHAARRAGIDVVYPDRPCDVMLDGADTVLPDGRLLKGGGGALVREKLLVRLSRRFVAVVEHAKVSTADDEADRSVSVAVLPFTWEQTLSELAQHCSSVELRTSRGAPYITDDGLLIADCVVGPDNRLDAGRPLSPQASGSSATVSSHLLTSSSQGIRTAQSRGWSSLPSGRSVSRLSNDGHHDPPGPAR